MEDKTMFRTKLHPYVGGVNGGAGDIDPRLKAAFDTLQNGEGGHISTGEKTYNAGSKASVWEAANELASATGGFDEKSDLHNEIFKTNRDQYLIKTDGYTILVKDSNNMDIVVNNLKIGDWLSFHVVRNKKNMDFSIRVTWK